MIAPWFLIIFLHHYSVKIPMETYESCDEARKNYENNRSFREERGYGYCINTGLKK